MSISNLKAAARQIAAAKHPEDIFGEVTGDASRAVGAVFRRMVPMVHPDHFDADPALKTLAQDALRRLEDLRAQAVAKIAAGTYGDRTVAAPTPAPAAAAPTTIKSGKSVFVVGSRIARGDVCDVYQCEADGKPAALKIAQHASVSDLVENEARSIATLRKDAPKGTERHLSFFPELLASFMLAGKPVARRVNVLPYYPEHFSLAEVKAAHPSGLDFRDLVWMFKRGLMALGFAHRRGIVHGAILPDHVIVHPTEHGAKILDWSYAVPIGGRVKAISAPHRAAYAPEILAKQPASPAADIFMLAGVIDRMLPVAGTPPKFTSFMRGVQIPNPKHRPQDAWDLHDELDALLVRLVGKPKYRALTMPERNAR